MDDSEQVEQLAKELASYQGGQPWRERQSAGQADDSPEQDVAPPSSDDENESLEF